MCSSSFTAILGHLVRRFSYKLASARVCHFCHAATCLTSGFVTGISGLQSLHKLLRFTAQNQYICSGFTERPLHRRRAVFLSQCWRLQPKGHETVKWDCVQCKAVIARRRHCNGAFSRHCVILPLCLQFKSLATNHLCDTCGPNPALVSPVEWRAHTGFERGSIAVLKPLHNVASFNSVQVKTFLCRM